MICAAGTGSRLGVGVPKCLVSVDGRSIIDRQLDLLDDVADVRVAVGFREELVVQHVIARRPDAIFVRNPDYQSTTTLDSLRRAVRHLDGYFIALDGDLLVEPESFRTFTSMCQPGTSLVGITPASTDDAVFVSVDDETDPARVTAFHRQPSSAFEWSGPAYLHGADLEASDGYVFEALVPRLPLRAQVLTTAEVDTPDDLERARQLVSGWDALPSSG